MRNKILLIFSLLFLTSFCYYPPRIITIKSDIFTIVYSEEFEQPLEIWYTVQCPNGKASRSGMDFYKCDSVRTSSHEDYENNVWDKGHLAPAADFSCDKETLYKTFTYLNCALQHQDLNRGVWRILESRERELAKIQDVKVHIRLDFSKNTIKQPTGSTVPGGFWKEIQYGQTTEIYYFPNIKPTLGQYPKYRIN